MTTSHTSLARAAASSSRSCFRLVRTLLAATALLATGLLGAEPALAQTDAAALERALATIAPSEISADVYFLASDELEGRDSPSQGQRIAARYIRARLQHLGWQPGAGSSYLYEYSLSLRRVDERRTGMRFTGGGQEVALTYGADYVFHNRSVWDASVSGGVVFCGQGSAEDFARAAEVSTVKGSWALCFDGFNWRERQTAAEAAGAVGLLVTRGDEEDAGAPYTEVNESWVRIAREGSLRGTAAKSGYPTLYVDRDKLAPVLALGMRAVSAGGGLSLGAKLPVELTEIRASEAVDIVLENVCGFWPGSDPELSKQVVILSAHYDHVGKDSRGAIYNGADDNGSGSATLMAVAEALTEYGPMRRSVMLLWVSAEEKGLLGSEAWTKAPTIPEGHRAVADVNIDMVGRNKPDELYITPSKSHSAFNGLTGLAQSLCGQEGFPELGSADKYWSRSDHANFYENLHIPVAFLFSEVHEDYHQPTDTADKIDYDKISRVTRLVVRMLDALSGDGLDPDNDWKPR